MKKTYKTDDIHLTKSKNMAPEDEAYYEMLRGDYGSASKIATILRAVHHLFFNNMSTEDINLNVLQAGCIFYLANPGIISAGQMNLPTENTPAQETEEKKPTKKKATKVEKVPEKVEDEPEEDYSDMFESDEEEAPKIPSLKDLNEETINHMFSIEE